MKKYLMDTGENSLPAVLSRLAIKQSIVNANAVLVAHCVIECSRQEHMLSAVKAEMAVFQSTGKRGRCLEAVYYRYLLTVPPTSVEAERTFSTARLMCTKVRSRLDDSSVDTLCFPGFPVIPRESGNEFSHSRIPGSEKTHGNQWRQREPTEAQIKQVILVAYWLNIGTILVQCSPISEKRTTCSNIGQCFAPILVQYCDQY